MIAPARRLAFRILQRIDAKDVFADDEMAVPEITALDPRDRNLITEIVYGTLRRQITLDFPLTETSTIPWEKVEAAVKVILRMSLYQMWYMDRIPDHAILNDAVELAKRSTRGGAAGFVNGVLRQLSRARPWLSEDFNRSLPRWAQVSLPQWLWERWSGRFGPEAAAAYAQSLCETPCCAFWRSQQPSAGSQVPGESRPSAIVPNAWLSETSVVDAGIWVQDEASQLVAYLIGPCRGWRVWDACACPGGKSALVSRNLDKTGLIVSSDIRFRRARRMARRLTEFVGCPLMVVADAARPSPFRIEFDAVLVDAPCSGLGTLRKNPEIKWRFKPDRLAYFHSRQVEILKQAADSVRPGGYLLYSTCSTEPEENEDVVESLLASRRDLSLQMPLHPPGIAPLLDPRGMVRTFPGTHLWDGLFAALMRRIS